MTSPVSHASPATPALPWLVSALTDHSGVIRLVADPAGLTPAGHRMDGPVSQAAAGLIDGRPVSWAWGTLSHGAPTPRVWFHSRWLPCGRRAEVRRLSATIWAAQAPGRWPRVWLSGLAGRSRGAN